MNKESSELAPSKLSEVEIRLSRPLYESVMADLRRRHPFAWERVGFLFGRPASAGSGVELVLLHRYHSIPDEHYLRDKSVGARIGQDAISQAMQDVYHGKAHRDGVFHVHLHDGNGEPSMSKTDVSGLPPMMPGFRGVNKEATHGIIILSSDHGVAWVWRPRQNGGARATRIVVAGAPMGIFEEEKLW